MDSLFKDQVCNMMLRPDDWMLLGWRFDGTRTQASKHGGQCLVQDLGAGGSAPVLRFLENLVGWAGWEPSKSNAGWELRCSGCFARVDQGGQPRRVLGAQRPGKHVVEELWRVRGTWSTSHYHLGRLCQEVTPDRVHALPMLGGFAERCFGHVREARGKRQAVLSSVQMVVARPRNHPFQT